MHKYIIYIGQWFTDMVMSIGHIIIQIVQSTNFKAFSIPAVLLVGLYLILLDEDDK